MRTHVPRRPRPRTRQLSAGLIGALLAASLPIVVGAAPSLPVTTTPAPSGCAASFCAGAASVDMTWHTGAGQGQLGSAGNGLSADRFDPFAHSTTMVPSEGLQSRAYAKAVVVSGADGTKAAVVKTEAYLQQELLTRRVAELVSGDDPTSDAVVDGLDRSSIILASTHNHSAPHHVSTAWGVWVFADTFDARQFEHTARTLADAIAQADAAREPARIGGSVRHLDTVQRNIIGPAVADDGTPAGFRRDHVADELAVVRLDALDDRPIAAVINFGLHPESLGGADLLSADFVGMVERDVERALGRGIGDELGPVAVWTQGGLGDVEPDRGQVNVGHEYWRRDFAQAERMSHDITDAVLATWEDVAAETPQVPAKFVPFTDAPEVAMTAERFAGPASHPVPTVSNCRTDEPAVPVAGLPDCQRLGTPPGYGATAERLRDAGLPVPDNYGFPSHTGVQETLTIDLQALRVGDILLGVCPCEPISDMALNFTTRTDTVPDNEHLGFEWDCREGGPTGAECDFRHLDAAPSDWRPVDPEAVARMRAQIRNDAAGWEDDLATLQGEAGNDGPPEELYGNFTHGEIADGYRLPLMVSMANDYLGYVVTNREYQRGDHYRKALTPFGPRTADYINTRLVAMAAELRGGPATRQVVGDTLGPLASADEASLTARTRVLGLAATVGVAGYEAALPDDGGTPGAVHVQPAGQLERFDGAQFTWEGGSNYTDDPEVIVERRDPATGRWEPAATQEGGEIVLTLDYESPLSSAPLDWLRGDATYVWTATFEVFDRTEVGSYRFVVAGDHRSGGQPHAYEVVSQPFEVRPWTGITVTDLTADRATGTVSFGVAGVEAQLPDEALVGAVGDLSADRVRYPSEYASDLSFLDGERTEIAGTRFCFRCTFRPWASDGQVVEATVTIVTAGQAARDGSASARTRHHVARFDGERFVVEGLSLGANDRVTVAPGAVRDEFGNVNGSGAVALP